MAEESDLYVRYLKLAHDYFQKGYINKDAATTQLSSGDAYKGGNIFSTIEPLKPGKTKRLPMLPALAASWLKFT